MLLPVLFLLPFLALDLVLPLPLVFALAITFPLSLNLIRLHHNPGDGQHITANTYVSTLAIANIH